MVFPRWNLTFDGKGGPVQTTTPSLCVDPGTDLWSKQIATWLARAFYMGSNEDLTKQNRDLTSTYLDIFGYNEIYQETPSNYPQKWVNGS